MAREGEEDVVQSGTVQTQLFDQHPCGVEVADDGGQQPRAASDRRSHVPAFGVDAYVAEGVTFQNPGGILEPVTLCHGHLEALSADPRLELARCALGDHTPCVDDGDTVSETVRLVEVLRREQ